MRTESKQTEGILSCGLNFVSGWSRQAKTHKPGHHLTLSENWDVGPTTMLLCDFYHFCIKWSHYQVELLLLLQPLRPLSRRLCWGIMLFLHLDGAVFSQTHCSSQSITFLSSRILPVFRLWVYFSLVFLLKSPQTSVSLAFPIRPPLSSPTPDSHHCLKRPKTARLPSCFSLFPEPVRRACLNLFSASD